MVRQKFWIMVYGLGLRLMELSQQKMYGDQAWTYRDGYGLLVDDEHKFIAEVKDDNL